MTRRRLPPATKQIVFVEMVRVRSGAWTHLAGTRRTFDDPHKRTRQLLVGVFRLACDKNKGSASSCDRAELYPVCYCLPLPLRNVVRLTRPSLPHLAPAHPSATNLDFPPSSGTTRVSQRSRGAVAGDKH